MAIKHIKGKGVWVLGAVSALLVLVGLFTTQAFSASMTVTSDTLQNSGGDLTYTTDYSGASAITRHESSDLTINGSDQITTVTVEGNKASGTVDVKVDLKDTSATIVDTKTVALPSAAGAFSTAAALTLGNIAYSTVATIAATYTASGSVAIVFDAASSDTATGKFSTYTWSHTVGAGGANRILIVGVATPGVAVSGVTYGGQAMTLVPNSAQSSAGSTARTELWYKVAPLENANDIVVTLVSSTWASAGATSWTGVHQTTPLGTAATATATSTTPSVNVTSGRGDVVVDALASDNDPVITVDGSQTQRWNYDNSKKATGTGSSEADGASSTTMSWSSDETQDWAIVGVALKQATP